MVLSDYNIDRHACFLFRMTFTWESSRTSQLRICVASPQWASAGSSWVQTTCSGRRSWMLTWNRGTWSVTRQTPSCSLSVTLNTQAKKCECSFQYRPYVKFLPNKLFRLGMYFHCNFWCILVLTTTFISAVLAPTDQLLMMKYLVNTPFNHIYSELFKKMYSIQALLQWIKLSCIMTLWPIMTWIIKSYLDCTHSQLLQYFCSWILCIVACQWGGVSIKLVTRMPTRHTLGPFSPLNILCT